MSWFDFFIRRKQAIPSTAVLLTGQPRAVSSPRSFENFSKESYGNNPIAYSCISKIATAIGGIPLLLKTQGKDAKEIEDHPLLDLLQRPNLSQNYQAFVNSVFGYFLIDGNSYIQAIGPNSKKVTEIWPLCPKYMKIVPGSYGVPNSYVYKPGENEYVYPVDQITGGSSILQLKTFNPLNQWYGMSPIEAAHYSVDQHNAAAKWNLGLLQNSARPSGALIIKPTDANPGGEIDEEQKEFLKNQINEQYTNAGNAGRPMLLYGGMDWKEMGISPKDMNWIEGRNTSGRDIALVFGVPSQLVNIPGDSTYANYEQAKLAFYLDTVIPIAKFWAGYLNMWLVPAFGENMFLEPDIQSIDALEPMRKEKWTQVNGANYLSINEKRSVLGYGVYVPSDDLANEIFIPPGLVPLSQKEDIDSEDYEDDPSEEDIINDDDADTEDDVSEDDSADDDYEDGEDDAEDEGKCIAYCDKKAFDLRSEASKRRYRFAINQKRDRLAKKFLLSLKRHWKKESMMMKRALKDPDISQVQTHVDRILDISEKSLKSVIEDNIKKTIRLFGKDILKLKSYYKLQTKDENTKFESALNEYVNTQVGLRIQNIKRTSRKRVIREVRQVISDGLAEGDVQTLVSNKIASIYSEFNRARALTIVRTETGMAQNFAHLEAAKAIDEPSLKKTWIATGDDRSRDSHLDMHNESVGLNEKFSVSSDDGVVLMDGPGDASAPAAEIINCRCVLTFEREKS